MPAFFTIVRLYLVLEFQIVFTTRLLFKSFCMETGLVRIKKQATLVRSIFIKVGLIVVFNFPLGVNAQTTWYLQSQAPAINPDFKAVQEFAKNIEVMTNGRLVIKTIAGDSQNRLSKGAGIYSAVKYNKVQMAVGWPNWWHTVNPAWNALQSGPYGFMNLDASMMWFFVGKGTEFANELSSNDGIIWRPAWWAGMELGLITQRNIRSLKDLSKKVVRIGPGIPNETLIRAAPGIQTVTIPSADIQKAFDSGRIHGIEWTVPSATIKMGFHRLEKDKANHIIVPAVWQPSVLGDFLINMEAFNKLTPDIQAILETAMKAFALTTTLRGKVEDMEAMEQFQQEGVTISQWSDEDLAQWKKQAEVVYSKHQNQSEQFKRFFKDKIEFKRKYTEYYKTHGSYEK